MIYVNFKAEELGSPEKVKEKVLKFGVSSVDSRVSSSDLTFRYCRSTIPTTSKDLKTVMTPKKRVEKKVYNPLRS